MDGIYCLQGIIDSVQGLCHALSVSKAEELIHQETGDRVEMPGIGTLRLSRDAKDDGEE
jgi:hypothetical protein